MTAFYEINEYSNTLYGIGSYQIFDIGCLTSTGAAAAFTNADNIISTLSDGKLKVQLSNKATLTTYNFCLKVTDDSIQGNFVTLDNLQLEVKKVTSCNDVLSLSSSDNPSPFAQAYNSSDILTTLKENIEDYFINTNEAECRITTYLIMNEGCDIAYSGQTLSLSSNNML